MAKFKSINDRDIFSIAFFGSSLLKKIILKGKFISYKKKSFISYIYILYTHTNLINKHIIYAMQL